MASVRDPDFAYQPIKNRGSTRCLAPRRSPTRFSTASSTMPIASISPETACKSHVRTPEIGAHLTTNGIRNIINLDLRKQTVGGRHQIGTLAGFRSEWAAGFVLECMVE